MSSYNPANVQILFGGIPIDGFAPDSFVTFTWQSEGAQTFAGARGDAVTVEDNNKNGELTFRLMATGVGRSVGSALATYANLGGPGLPLAMICSDTGEAFICAEAKIKRAPNAEFATGAAPIREWTIVCPKTTYQQVPDPSAAVAAVG